MSATIQRTATLTMSNNTSTRFLGKNRERCPKLEMRLTVRRISNDFALEKFFIFFSKILSPNFYFPGLYIVVFLRGSIVKITAHPI